MVTRPGKSLTWSPALDSAFRRAKALLAAVLELIHPRPGAQISLAVDASDSHVGSVLQQFLDGFWAPLAFFSKKLSVAERKYSVFNRELLAAYSSLRCFRFLLEGRDFTIFTDHKPLTLALFGVSLPWSAWQQCHLVYLAELTSSVVHDPGIENVTADALSRPSPEPELVPAPVSVHTASSLVSPCPPHLTSASPSLVLSDPALSSYNFRRFSALQLSCSSVSGMNICELF